MSVLARSSEEQAAATGRTSPYQGLVPYSEADEEWFFGRAGEREVVIDSLRAYRVSVLYGESGVGKSSLLRGSVLPHLRHDAGTSLASEGIAESLPVVFAEWSVHDPLGALKQAVCEAASTESPQPPGDASGTPLADLLSMCSERVGGVVFVILDQFEELFLYHGSDAAGRAFEDELVQAIRRRDIAANFLLSIREDALAKLDRLQARVPDLLDNLVRLHHLDEPGARDAIERPLAHWNALTSQSMSIEPALVEELLAQVQTGMLLLPGVGGRGRVSTAGTSRRIEAPYLQLVLMRIWQEERDAGSELLRLETLDRLGGAERIVRTHLDAVLDTLSRRDRSAAAVAMRYLVTPSGTKIALRVPDLVAYTGVPTERLERVLAALSGEARILRPVTDGAYEIYHDVLAAAVLDWRRRYEERRDKSLLARAITLVTAAAVIAIASLAYQGHVLQGLENDTLDTRFSIRGPEKAPKNIVVVGIDDATFQDVNKQWPFPRAVEAKVLNHISAGHPSVVAFDIVFAGPSQLGQNDDVALLNAIGNSKAPVVLSFAETDSSGDVQLFGVGQRQSALRQAGVYPAGTQFPLDSGGYIRRMSYSIGHLTTLPVVVAQLASGRHARPFSSTRWIDSVGPAGTFTNVSYGDVYAGRIPPSFFRDKIVLIGPTTPSLQDLHPTPTDAQMPGVEVQANAIATALDGYPLRTPTGSGLALVALLGMLVALASLRLKVIALVATILVIGVVYLIAAQLAFDDGTVLNVTSPLLALVLVGLVLVTVGVLRRYVRPRPI